MTRQGVVAIQAVDRVRSACTCKHFGFDGAQVPNRAVGKFDLLEVVVGGVHVILVEHAVNGDLVCRTCYRDFKRLITKVIVVRLLEHHVRRQYPCFELQGVEFACCCIITTYDVLTIAFAKQVDVVAFAADEGIVAHAAI